MLREDLKIQGKVKWIRTNENLVCVCRKIRSSTISMLAFAFKEYPGQVFRAACGNVHTFICFQAASTVMLDWWKKTAYICSAIIFDLKLLASPDRVLSEIETR